MRRELTYITAIAQEKSISKAAQKLHISQPSLSHCLSALEERLGTKLFYRRAKGLSLTYAGEKYYNMALDVLARYAEFESSITEINAMKQGRISFGITNFLALRYLSAVLPVFAKKYPNIKLIPCEANSLQLEQMVLERQIDFSLMFMHPSRLEAYPAFNIEILREEFFVLFASPESGLARYAQKSPECEFPVIDPRHAADMPFILLPPEQRTRQVTDCIFKNAGIQPPVRMIVKNHETARRLCARGMGLTIIPYRRGAIDESQRACCYRLPPECDARWYIVFVTMKDGYVPLASRELMTCFRSNMTGDGYTAVNNLI